MTHAWRHRVKHLWRPLPFVALLLLAVVVPAATAPTAAPAASVRGQSVTRLPDGRWLLLGGEARRGVRDTAELRSADGGVTVLAGPLGTPRAWHTATVLPDGTVLVLAGVNAAGDPLGAPEVFDPATGRFEPVSLKALAPRAHHTATLLTDGTLLIAGGVSAGGVRTDAQVVDPVRGTVVATSRPLTGARRSHEARLLPDGTVMLWGGRDAAGHPRQDGEVFDPQQGTFVAIGTPIARSSLAPELAGAVPEDGATDVPLESVIALRFSKPVRVETVTPLTVLLTGPHGLEPAHVVAAEGGALVFVTPRAPLAAGTAYTVSINGVRDDAAFLVPPTAVRFTTTAQAPAHGHEGPAGKALESSGHDHGAQGHHDEHASLAERDDFEWKGERRNGRPYSRWQSLLPLQAPAGVTALAGQVLRLNGQPLADVTIRVGYRSARTDATGRFLVQNLHAGYPTMDIEGATASRPGRTYGHFAVGVDIDAGQTNVLPYTIWMPLIDTAHATRLPVPTRREVVATTPRIPGLEVHVPAGVVLQTADGPLTSITLTRIPVDRPPFPLPEGAKFSFTPQTHSAVVQRPDGSPSATGVRFIMPNVEGLAAGTRVDLWTYDTSQRWYRYGQGTVSKDGTQIVPDRGVEFHAVTCYFILGGDPGAVASIIGGARDGDPVDLATGLFLYEKVDLVVDDVIPIVISRHYRQGDTNQGVRAFGLNFQIAYQMFLTGDASTYSYADLNLADGGKVRFTRISAGTGYADAVMEHTATPTRFYKARLTWNPAHGWEIAFKDGTVYEFIVGNPGSMLTAIRDRHGNRLTVARPFGVVHNLLFARIVSPNGRWVDVTWDGQWRITQVRDHAGRTVSYTYDGASRLASVTDAQGGVTSYTYNTNVQMLTVTDPKGITYLTNTYAAGTGASRLTSQTQADGTTYQFAYTTDATGKVIQTDVTDPRGTVRRVTFNSAGYPLTDTRALGQAEQQTTTYVRQAGSSLVTSVTDALGRVTAYTYDTVGNVTTVTRLSGTSDAVTTTYTYEPTFNQVASVTDPLGHTTSLTYDSAGNLTTITDPLSHATTITYNGAGQPVTVTNAVGQTVSLGYDQGDLATVTDPLGNVTTRFTDAVGRLVAVTNALGQRTRYTYDALNQVTAITDAVAGVTQLGYDGNGNLTSVTDARGNATTYAYSNMDRVTTRTDPLTRAETYGYDANGNPTGFTDRKSQVSSTTYDRLNRPLLVTYADGSTTAYTWDAGNRLTQLVDSVAGTLTRTYDGLDRLTQETTPQGTISYTYDAASRRATMTVAGQPTVTYTYDTANRLTGITQGTATIGFAYDNADRRILLTLPNGTSTEYGYDAASRLTGLTYKAGTTTLGTLTYAYDAAGARTTVGGTWARTGQPAAVASATYNAANHQVTFGGTTLTYDLNGNLTSDGTTTYTWNARNQLVSITGPVAASFVYDGAGRRQTKTIAGTTTSFLHDGSNPVQEQSGAALANLLTGLGIDEYFVRTDGAGAQTFWTDALGSTVALTDATATVAVSYTYEAFGATAISGTTGNGYDYTGRESDPMGLKYYRARYYHPRFQRFLAEDPIGLLAGDPNFYAYVQNAPLTFVDPFGLDKECAGAEISNSSLLQVATDAAAGFGDGVSLGTTRSLRTFAGINGRIRMNCGLYRASEAMGAGWMVALNIVGAATGYEFKIGKNWRIAPWGNRTGDPYGSYPHYHRRGAPGADSKTPPGQGIGRHRPFEPSQHDRWWGDRF
jgi:RHS repeat-associated protein